MRKTDRANLGSENLGQDLGMIRRDEIRLSRKSDAVKEFKVPRTTLEWHLNSNIWRKLGIFRSVFREDHKGALKKRFVYLSERRFQLPVSEVCEICLNVFSRS